MLNVFHRDGETIRHFWASELFYAPADPGQEPRHVGTIEPLWNLFDLTPEGRGTDWDEQLSYDDSSPVRLDGVHGVQAPCPSRSLALLSLSAVSVPLTRIAESTRNEQDLPSAGTRAGPLLLSALA